MTPAWVRWALRVIVGAEFAGVLSITVAEQVPWPIGLVLAEVLLVAWLAMLAPPMMRKPWELGRP